MCCTKSSHIESRTVPLPGQKPHANSHPVVFRISLLHQLSKLQATNLLCTSTLCFFNASELVLPMFLFCSLCSFFLSWSFPQKRVESVQVFTLSQLPFKCFVYGLIDDVELSLKVFYIGETELQIFDTSVPVLYQLLWSICDV